jgi:hypothetical protein
MWLALTYHPVGATLYEHPFMINAVNSKINHTKNPRTPSLKPQKTRQQKDSKGDYGTLGLSSPNHLV